MQKPSGTQAEDRSGDVIGVGRDEHQEAPVLDHPDAAQVDEERFGELERKKQAEGLTDDEANELGRMISAKEGRPYSNADARAHPDAGPEPESAPGAAEVDPDPERARSDPGQEESRDQAAKDLAG
jgi:hypothetical protein